MQLSGAGADADTLLRMTFAQIGRRDEQQKSRETDRLERVRTAGRAIRGSVGQ